ncbi:unnamed protein product [Thelazia callipaeda]|uniref:Uncharacterized protein n=1 Tax=Thelazia callipaeda TaxID=103827 RepID=A0A0N5D0H5_THECL|nr:unnamed protein product [Thelazia callipaeda]
MKVNGRNTITISCDNRRNGIDSQRRQNGGTGNNTREYSRIQIDQLSSCWERSLMNRPNEEQPVSHNVGTEEIREFWATMWNSKMEEDDDSRHNEYLE